MRLANVDQLFWGREREELRVDSLGTSLVVQWLGLYVPKANSQSGN